METVQGYVILKASTFETAPGVALAHNPRAPSPFVTWQFTEGENGLCLPLDCACYMLHKCWTGAYCRYFREAVLPLDPELQASLTTEGISPELRACAVCGKAFLPEGRQAYCSDACKAEGNRRKSRERMRKMREKRPGGCYDLPPPKA